MEKFLTVEHFFSLFPYWYIAACFVTGFVVFPIMLAILAKPLARGLSHGLYEVVLYWKADVSLWGVFKRFLKVIYFDFPLWGILNSTTTKTSIGPACWYGVFGWYYEKSFTRANSKRKNAEKEAAK
uniref:Holin n=1 Tax=Pseudomonas phage HRDY3 TaxID=3236930 RepID=A0AB39CEV2_9VIRU